MLYSPMDIYNLLPKKNCKECGFPSCMAFAVKMLRKDAFMADCPYIDDPEFATQKIKLKEIAADILKAGETKIIINTDLCDGCGNCVISCPPDVLVSLNAAGGKGPETKDVVYDVEDGVLILTNLKLCRRYDGDIEARPCRICIEACPRDAIEII
ncbi:MAG: (Fe-S)-binding protein [Candidatus Hydrothermarchaeales archaeon]